MILSRYMSLDRFIDLCEKGLYMISADFFLNDDSWEGVPALHWNTISDQEKTEKWNKYVKEQLRLGNPYISEKDFEVIPKLSSLENVRKAMSWIYVSCWHMSDEESMAMWKLYSQSAKGVCIQVSIDKLKAVLKNYFKTQKGLFIMASAITYNRPGERIE